MKILVAGARGYIGSATVKRFRAEGEQVVPLSSSVSDGYGWLDLGNKESFSTLDISHGDIVLLTAAISSPDMCAKEPERVRLVNVAGTSEFVSMCTRNGVRVLFFSSDTVYGEREDAFDESAVCNPAGEYAMMKHELECRFLGNPLFKTIRLSYVFSGEDKFTKYLLGCASRGVEAEIYHPFFRAIVHRDDVVQGTLALVRRWDDFSQSVINFGGPDVIARIDFAQSLKDSVLPALMLRRTEPEPDYFLNRPRVIRMKSPFLPLLLGRSTHSLREAIQIEFNQKGKGGNA